jgi:AcrR family transcriptional regulator
VRTRVNQTFSFAPGVYDQSVATAPTDLRRARERELVAATRALFDERGVLDAPVEEIARAVGIARGLIYRQFSSKEELFVLTVTDYLDELGTLLEQATPEDASPVVRLERCTRAFAGFGQRYPAFLDASLSLMHRPSSELRGAVSDSVWLRLGEGMARCLGRLADVLRSGAASGAFATVEDPDVLASVLWTQMLGAMHLARIREGVRRTDEGRPELLPIDPDALLDLCVRSALATVGAVPVPRDSDGEPV